MHVRDLLMVGMRPSVAAALACCAAVAAWAPPSFGARRAALGRRGVRCPRMSTSGLSDLRTTPVNPFEREEGPKPLITKKRR